MRRFFIEEIDTEDGLCLIPEKEAKHMVKVLRITKGDHIILMDGKGERFEAVMEEVTRHKVYARIIKELPRPLTSPIAITICQALLKPYMMDYMVEKTSELGVFAIMPYYSERTVFKLDENNAFNKKRHWKKIAQSATKQSDRLTPSDISAPVEFDDMIKLLWECDGLKVVLWEGENITDLKALLCISGPSQKFTGVIGPEGGFSQKEISKLREAGTIPVSLGSRILRAETAAIALTTVIQYEWGDLGIQKVDQP